MEFSVSALEPAFPARAGKCGWNDTWRKHGLLEWGRLFCLTIGDALTRGFSAGLGCDMAPKLSRDAACCEFAGRQPLTQEEAARAAAKKTDLGLQCVKDCDYHTGYALYSVARGISGR